MTNLEYLCTNKIGLATLLADLSFYRPYRFCDDMWWWNDIPYYEKDDCINAILEYFEARKGAIK